jgi:pimeloyl-ACP methyl ester carboxylesterase
MSAAPGARLAIDGRLIETLDLPGDSRRGALLLAHEGLGSVELWRGLPQDLHQRTSRRVVAFSRFGHGRSQRPARPRTPEFFHEEALGVLPALRAQLALGVPILVGHSDGASIALIHAAHHPVAGLILIAPHVFVEPITVAAIRRTRQQFVDGSLRRRMARYHDDVDAAFWGWCDVWLDPEFEAWNLEGEVARVTAPTLLIQGDQDPYGTLEQLDRIQAHLPSARRLVLPGGHSPHLEQRETVLGAICDFLGQLP